MSGLQKEAAACKALGRRYQKIAAVFETMPDRFKLADLLKASGLGDGYMARSAITVILYRDFKCIDVGPRTNRVWKKPAISA